MLIDTFVLRTKQASDIYVMVFGSRNYIGCHGIHSTEPQNIDANVSELTKFHKIEVHICDLDRFIDIQQLVQGRISRYIKQFIAGVVLIDIYLYFDCNETYWELAMPDELNKDELFSTPGKLIFGENNSYEVSINLDNLYEACNRIASSEKCKFRVRVTCPDG